MQQLLMVVHLFSCISIVVLVLIQHGKGADAGAAFGSGASGTVFGSQGSGSFLLKVTTGIAAIFFATSIALAYLTSYQVKHQTTTSLMEQPVEELAPIDEQQQTSPGEAFVEPELDDTQQ